MTSSSDVIKQSGRQAVVFRQHCPPRHGTTELSFWGGVPVGPASLVWPSAPDKSGEETALSFIMQINCAAVPERARLNCFPDTGVLYFFLDLNWGCTNAHRVLYVPNTHDCRELATPQTLKPVFGTEAKYHFPGFSENELPRVLPKWTFEPVVIDIENPRVIWFGEDEEIKLRLHRAQGEDIRCSPFHVQEFYKSPGVVARPYDAFPHDWHCVRVVAAMVAEHSGSQRRHGQRFGEQFASEIESAHSGGNDWVTLAAQHNPWDSVPESKATEFWEWLIAHSQAASLIFGKALTTAIESSLAHSIEAASRIPPEFCERIHHRHALASGYVSKNRSGDDGDLSTLIVNTPDRMLAPPVDVQGNLEEFLETHLLLLEMSFDEGIGHHFGEGVYQFWITPDDLKNRRFDKVELTTDAY